MNEPEPQVGELMRAIRIIRKEGVPPFSFSDESGRDDLSFIAQNLLAASQRLKEHEAQTTNTADIDLTIQEAEIKMSSVDEALREVANPMQVHSDIQLSRIFELLED